jgi:uncharacterized membrane protein YphA (DoxX/SURF4 family)
MTVVALVCRVGLAVVFATAGISKLRDLPGTRQAVGDFGVPQPAAPTAAVLLPLTELVVATALVVPATAVGAATAALALLAFFSAGIAGNLVRGQRPDCHCFGQLHSTPIGTGALVRNGVLAAVALVIVAAG